MLNKSVPDRYLGINFRNFTPKPDVTIKPSYITPHHILVLTVAWQEVLPLLILTVQLLWAAC
jgi:hypothetical protein